jgi:hypothetical protein
MARRIPVAAMLILLVLLLAGCGILGGRRDQAEQERAARDAAQREIERQLRREAGVTRVDVHYTKDFSTAGGITVVVVFEADQKVDLERFLDVEERVVWQSTLAPLTGMDLTASDTADPPRVHGRLVSITPEERERLDAKYGPRPVAPTGSG